MFCLAELNLLDDGITEKGAVHLCVVQSLFCCFALLTRKLAYPSSVVHTYSTVTLLAKLRG
jgi:hypothetical protein